MTGVDVVCVDVIVVVIVVVVGIIVVVVVVIVWVPIKKNERRPLKAVQGVAKCRH